MTMARVSSFTCLFFVSVDMILLLYLLGSVLAEPFRRDVGHPHWHHSAFQDVPLNYRHEMKQLLHSRAQVYLLIHPFTSTKSSLI